MAVEARRGCGYRKVGGLYLVGSGSGMACCKMPLVLHVCPTCNAGIKQTRGWTWIDPRPWFKGACTSKDGALCPGSMPEVWLGQRVGLIWVGGSFYPTKEAFAHEADTMGISRRITAVPRGFKVGEHWVFIAHPKGVQQLDPTTGEMKWLPAVFRIFKPTAIEKIITQTMSEDPEIMADLEKRGIRPVIVPDDDKDHQGTVYEDFSEEELPLES